jgi:hypothetical protein
MRFTPHQAKMQRQLPHQILLCGFVAPFLTTALISGLCYEWTLLTARTRTERMSVLAGLRGGVHERLVHHFELRQSGRLFTIRFDHRGCLYSDEFRNRPLVIAPKCVGQAILT